VRFGCFVDSQTAAMSDAFETYQDRIAEYQTHLKYVEGATGLAVAMGGRVASIDFFDRPATCQRVWDRILSGMALDALSAAQVEQQSTAADVQQLLTADFPWEQVDAVGRGGRVPCRVGERGSRFGACVGGSRRTRQPPRAVASDRGQLEAVSAVEELPRSFPELHGRIACERLVLTDAGAVSKTVVY
jgi:hypothetical protein